VKETEMKFFAFVLVASIGGLLAALPAQETETLHPESNNTELSLSLHFLDGLSSGSNERLPDIRFLHHGCHLSLLVTNKTDNKTDNNTTLWKPNCPEGDRAIRLEFKKTSESTEVGVARISHSYTGGMGIPKTFILGSGDSLVHRIDLSSYWSFPFVLNDGDDATVFVRAVYESEKADGSRSFLPNNSDDVWVGKLATEWTQVRLANVSGKPANTRNDTNILK